MAGEDAPRSSESEFVSAPPDVVRALSGAGLLPAIYFFFGRKVVEAAAESCQRLACSRPEMQPRSGCACRSG